MGWVPAAEELRLERLAMGERCHPAEEELEAREADMFQPKECT
jgi:hypothetical protein